jgi:hypothetical protein
MQPRLRVTRRLRDRNLRMEEGRASSWRRLRVSHASRRDSSIQPKSAVTTPIDSLALLLRDLPVFYRKRCRRRNVSHLYCCGSRFHGARSLSRYLQGFCQLLFSSLPCN